MTNKQTDEVCTNTFLFGVQGIVWQDESKKAVITGNVVLKMSNQRNGLVDTDVVGREGGTIPEDGWFTVTLANLEGGNAVAVGDKLIFELFGGKDHKTKLRDLGEHIVTLDDVRSAGFQIDFDLAGGQ